MARMRIRAEEWRMMSLDAFERMADGDLNQSNYPGWDWFGAVSVADKGGAR